MKELFINSKLVELDSQTKLDLQFKSFLFSGISELTAPRSWTVSLPKSASNLALIQGASSGDYDGDFPYDNYVVDYYSKGCRVINQGKGILIKITDRIEFTFSFGKAYDAIKLMTEKNLTELIEEETDYLLWNRSISLNDMSKGFGWCNFYSFTNEDRTYDPTTGNEDVPFAILHPTITFNYIMTKIQSLFAISLASLMTTFFDSCSFPLRELDGVSAIKISTSSSASQNSSGIVPNVTFYNSSLTNFTLISHVYFTKKISDSEIYVENMNYSQFLTPDAPQNATIKLCALDESNNVIVIKELDKTFVSGTTYHHTLTNYSFLLDKNYKSFYFAVSGFSSGGAGAPTLTFDSYYEKAYYNPSTSGGFYPIIPNLPDMTCADFLFQAMQLAGVFPVAGTIKTILETYTYVNLTTEYNPLQNKIVFTTDISNILKVGDILEELDGNPVGFTATITGFEDIYEAVFSSDVSKIYADGVIAKFRVYDFEEIDSINFFSADVLYDNVENAKDWTNKLVKTNPRMNELSDVAFKFGSYAKKNILKYEDDETNLLDTSSYLEVKNNNLEDETNLVELKFAAGKRFSTTENIIDYPLYDIQIQSGVLVKNAKTQNNDVIAEIVNVSSINYLKFTDNLLWSSLKTANYSGYQSLILKPRYLCENFYLKPEDVADINLGIPIYLNQYGKYYAIMLIQYKEEEISECELLEIKNI